MTPEKAFEVYGKGYFSKDDFIQDCYLALLEHPDLEESILFKEVAKKHKKEHSEQYRIAPHLYNEDGECYDDDIYFVDKRTIEERGVREFNTELKEKGLKLAKVMRCYDSLFKQVFIHKTHLSTSIIKWIFGYSLGLTISRNYGGNIAKNRNNKVIKCELNKLRKKGVYYGRQLTKDV